jgi:RNA polymerase sigma-70 factor (ECF subfamily)
MAEPADVPELLARHRSQIDRLVCRLVDPGDRDDVTQELALAALQRPPRSPFAWPAWIATTVRNVAAKRLRGQGRARRREEAVALPERLPSSAELEARLDQEQALLRAVRELPAGEREVVQLRFFEGLTAAQIGAALGLGESTVRARLQRSVAALRSRLDGGQPGGRRAWMAALAPWSVPTFLLPVAPSAGIAAAAALVVGVSLAWPWIATTRDGDAGAGDTAPARAARSVDREDPDRDPPPLARAAGVAAERALAPAPATSAQDQVTEGSTTGEGGAAASRPAPPARLILRCVNAATREQLPMWTCRAISETRFLERMIGVVGSDRFAVTPGRWQLRLSALGCEPVYVGPLDLASGEERDLGAIALERGSGRIAGRLERLGAAADKPAWVELLGEGRAPCPRCDPATGALPPEMVGSPIWPPPAPVSECCGWFKERSVVEVDAAGRFAFENLAAGDYHLRAFDGRHPVQPTTALVVARGGQTVAELVLAPPVELLLTLREAGGAPFVGRWWPEDDAEPPPIHFDVVFETLATTLDMAVDLQALRALEGPAPRAGMGPIVAEDELRVAWSAEGFAFSFSFGDGDVPADRARAPDESLEPPVVMPGFSGSEFAVARLAPDLFRVRPLPAAPIRFRLRCADHASDWLDVDLADPANHHLTVTLKPDPTAVPPPRCEGIMLDVGEGG